MNENDKNNNYHSLACRLAKMVKSVGWLISLARSHAPRRHSPRKRVRRRITATLTLVIIVLSFATATYNLAGERFNNHLINALTRITGGEIEIDFSEINVFSDIRINGLRVYIPDKPHEHNSLIFSASDILISYNPWSILSTQLQIDRIVANNAMLNLVYDYDDKSWNINSLKLNLTPSSSSKRKTVPDFIVRDSYIQYKEYRNSSFSEPVQQQFAGKLFRSPNDKIIIFDFYSHEQTALPNCVITGTYNPDMFELNSEMKFDMQNFAAETLPPNLAAFKNLYNAINPRGEIILKSTYSRATGNQIAVIFDKASAGIKWFADDAILPLPEISGEVICTMEKTSIESVLVKFDDATFVISGSVNGYSSDSDIKLLFASDRLSLPENQWDNFDILASSTLDSQLLKQLSHQAQEKQAFAQVLKMLICAMPEKNKKIFHELLPTGLANINVSFNRVQNNNSVSGDIQVINGAGSFHKFPYPAKKVSGPIHFEPGKVAFGPMVTNYDDMTLEVNGAAFKNELGKWDIVTDVKVDNLIIDQTLFNALNDKQKELFDLFKPSGRANAHYNIHVVQGEKPSDQLNINFNDINGTFKFFPAELQNCSGNIYWDRNKTEFNLENALLANGTLSVSGSLAELDNDTNLICDLIFSNITLNSLLTDKLPPALKTLYDKIAAEGILSGSAYINNIFDGPLEQLSLSDSILDDIEHNIDLILSDGSVCYQEIPIEMHNVNTSVNITNKVLTIHNFNALFTSDIIDDIDDIGNDNSTSNQTITTAIEIHGILGPESYDLNLSGQNLLLRQEIQDFCNSKIPELWNNYNPQGITNLQVQICNSVDNILQYQCLVEPVKLNAIFMDYPLEDIKGKLVFANNKIQLENFSFDNEKVTISGNLLSGHNLKDYYLHVKTNKLPIDDKLKLAFDDKVEILNEKFAINGDMSSNLEIALHSTDPNDLLWRVNGNLKLENTSAKLPLQSNNIDADLKIHILFDQFNNYLQANASSDNFNASIMDRPINNANFDLSYDSKTNTLDVNIPYALFCDGPAEGKITANLEKNNTYELQLVILNSKLSELAVIDPNSPQMNGFVDGFLRLNSFHNQKNGSFNFNVSQGNLGKLPLLVGIISMINIGSTHSGAFSQAAISGSIVDDITIFNEIAFKGDSIGITGKGYMVGPFAADQNRNGNIDLTFMIDAPDIIKPIPIIGSLFNAIRSGIIYVQADGKYNKPSIKPVTLSIIGDLFRNKRKLLLPK